MEVDFSKQIKNREISSEDTKVISEQAWAKEKNAGKKLNKPFRTSGGPKKFSVYVKNEKGNVVKVNFGDPNMEIKRDDPARRKSFRARHKCDNPGPKTKAKYWSCKMWSKKSVTDVTKGSEENLLAYLDESDSSGSNIFDNIRKKKDYCKKNPSASKCKKEDRPSAKNWKKAVANPDVEKHYFNTKEEAMKDAKRLGLKGYHEHKAKDGSSLFMAGPNHESFIKKHKELTNQKK